MFILVIPLSQERADEGLSPSQSRSLKASSDPAVKIKVQQLLVAGNPRHKVKQTEHFDWLDEEMEAPCCLIPTRKSCCEGFQRNEQLGIRELPSCLMEFYF